MSEEALSPYLFHGLEFREGSKEAITDCPFCGKEQKFSVNVSDKPGTFRCPRCNVGGNQYKFLELLWKEGQGMEDLSELAQDRGLEISTLRAWGVSKSVITLQWLVPGFNTKGELRQLYRYAKMKNGKMRLLATPTIHHAIHGIDLYDPKKQVVYLCEGPWDAMKLWEVLGSTVERDGKFVRTRATSKSKTMLGGANVLAVPGCTTFHESWRSVFLGKRVYIVYDSDHPKKHPKTGKVQPPVGYTGAERVSHILGSRTKETRYLRWGPKGYDPKLPSGTDVRDFLNGKGDLGKLVAKLHPVPDKWKTPLEQKNTQRHLTPLACDKWMIVSNAWRRSPFKWGAGLDITLSVMLASIVSTDIVGDQLWIKVIGPASCGKSTLCEAVSLCKEYVVAKSTIRGFHSGFKTDGQGAEDNSLIVQVTGKTLVTKDGDTLLQSPNLGQILSEARDIYDKTSRSHYRNKMGKDYTDIHMTWILCGTSSLRSIDSSELGERFLDCVIMEGIDDDWEDEVLLMKVESEDVSISQGRDGKNAQLEDTAKRLTAGYVKWLRDNDQDLLADVVTPKAYRLLIARLGKFVACMRARPSELQQEAAEREFGARLVSQLIRLAKCLAVVLNRPTVDRRVMQRVLKVALDTSRGVTYNLCQVIRRAGEEGASHEYLALEVNKQQGEVIKLLRFLKDIGVCEGFSRKVKGVRTKKRWRLTEKMEVLFNNVMDWETEYAEGDKDG